MPDTSFVPLGDGFTVARQTTDDFLEVDWLGRGGTLYALLYEAEPYAVTLPGLNPYLDNKAYVGSLVGPIANRTANAQFLLDNQTYTIPANEGSNSLHSGPDGFDSQDWTMKDCGEGCVALSHTSPDGYQGFPGNLDVQMTSQVESTSVTLTYTASTDAPTPFAPTQHTYFRIPGMETIDDLTLQIFAESYTRVDESNIPTDYNVPVSGTKFDFRTPKIIGDHFMDHSFNVRGGGLRPHARLTLGDRSILISSTLPAVQIFTGEALARMGLPSRSGLAVEPQFPPNWINTDNAEDMILRPDQTARHIIRYEISRIDPEL